MLGTLRFQRRRHSMCHLAFEFDRMHLSIFSASFSPALVCWRLAERSSFNRQCHPAGIQPACNEATGQADRMDAKGHRPMRRRRGVRGGGEGGEGGRRGGAGRLPGPRRAGGAVVPGGPGDAGRKRALARRRAGERPADREVQVAQALSRPHRVQGRGHS